jgi:serine/threonine-protein kinase
MKSLDTRESGDAAVLRFLEEAQITGQLDHPGVVPVHDFGISDDDGRAYFTMKLVRGEPLSILIAAHQRFGLAGRPLERLLGAFVRVCEAIAFAHTRGVVHCDLKPDNILIGSHGQVYVMDWGLALVLEGGRPSERVIRKREVAGTPAYMAPEQAHADVAAIGPRTDVYGLGAVLFAILTGRGPHHAETSAAALEGARTGSVDESRLESAPPELARIALRALAPRREDRYASVEELGRDVEEFLRGGGWFRTRAYEAGEVILEEGEPGSVAYVLADGRCEVFKTVEGVKVPLRVLEAGDVFGETAVFTSKPRSATVVALTPCTVKIVTRDALERELERNPWMGAFVRAVAERFREADEKLTSLRPPASSG